MWFLKRMNKCLVCKNNTVLYIKKRGYQIFKCEYCGLGKTYGLKIQQGDYHRDSQYLEEEKLFKNIFEKRANIIDKLGFKGKILEVGCSTGLLLSILKNKGWDVMGVEVSKKSAKKAEERGIRVILDDFVKIKTNQKYDAVIFNHTLEHLENPIQVLKKAENLLNKGGLLYIDLPNFDSLTAKTLKANWPLLLPQEHLWHFTLKSLQILLQDLGFKIIYTERASGVFDYKHPIKGILISLMTFKKRFFTESLTLIPSFVTSKLNIGSDLMVIAKKNG